MKIINLSLIALLALAANTAIGQKLSTIQIASLRAPSNIKIDGKATEWNNQFQAYNKATEVYYTIANDDENIYLVVQANKPRIIEKIMAVGVTFIVNSNNKKSDNDKESASITFPILSVTEASSIINTAGIKSHIAGFKLEETPTDKEMEQRHDSLIIVANKLLTTQSNLIKVKGIKGIADTISVYNEQHIKAASAFNNNSAYTYELAIPLKLLNLSADYTPKFSYSIKLPSRLDDLKKGTRMVYKYVNDMPVDADLDLDSTTDFWGEYTLAKK